MGTTPKGLPFPDVTDAPDGPTQIAALATAVDGMPGVSALTYAQMNALTGADLWHGRVVYQTNTGTNRPLEGMYYYDGIGWRKPWNQPWGLMAEGFSSGDGSLVTAATDVAGLAVTFTAVTNRRYLFKVQCRVTKGAGTGDVALYVTTPGNASQWQLRQTVVALDVRTIKFDFPVPAPGLAAIASGSVTRKVRIESFTSNVAATEEGAGHNYLAVYDDGPVPGTDPA